MNKNAITYKLLLVEDDEDDYILAKSMLEESTALHFDLTWAQDYNSGLELSKNNDFDTILVDYRLGQKTGLDLLKELKESKNNKSTAPIILLTGAGDHEIDLKAMESGASDYLIKGQIDAIGLERAIRYSIEQSKSQEKIHHLNRELEQRVKQRTKELELANKQLLKEIAERKLAQEQYYNLAYYDTLTGLPNRSMLNIRLQQAVEDAQRTKLKVAVMFIDLDGFKNINDTLGHLAGDNLLIEVGKRLKRCTRTSDIVCRHGGDEFIIVMSNLIEDNDAIIVADKIIKVLSKPIKVELENVCISPSIGISIYPIDTNDMENMVKLADIAMYYSKKQGKNTYRFYKKEMIEEIPQKIERK